MSDKTYPWIETYNKTVDWHMDIPAKPVYALMDEALKDYADRPAFDFLGKIYSWQEIAILVNKVAAGLQEQGVEKGDKVGLFLPNTPYYLICYYAILKAGGTVVNFNPLYAEEELSHQIEDSGCEIMISLNLKMLHDKMKKMLQVTRLKKLIVCRFTDILPFPKNILFPLLKPRDIARIRKTKGIIWFESLTENSGNPVPIDINPKEDLAVLQYTGGTTGVPKGAMLTHYNVYANTLQSAALFENVELGGQKMLGVLPFFHVFAMTAIMNFSVKLGLEIIAMPRFDLKDALKIIEKKRPHFFPAVPAIYTAINNYKDRSKYDLSSLEYCISGGAPLPVEVKKNFEEITGCIVVEGYGLTESAPVACVNPLQAENLPGSIGLPVPGTVIEIIDPDDKTTLMPQGERGELCIRGPQVMRGYWNNEAASADVLRPAEEGESRLHTGDIAIMDERGYVFIVDRIKDMIITNGYNVYPRNIEEAIYKHPDVEECIVAGLPDKNRGEIVKAWIKLKEGRSISGEDLKKFLSNKISKMEIPKRIEFRTAPLPKTMIGKLSRKDIVAEELEKA